MGAIQRMLMAVPTGSSVAYWNSSDKGALIVLSGTGNSISTSSSAGVNWDSVRSITSHSTGLWYAEENMTVNTVSNNIFGVATSAATLTDFAGSDAFGWSIQNNATSTRRTNGVAVATGLTPPALNERSMVAYNATTGNIWLGARGLWAGGGDPAAGTIPTYTVAAGTTLFLIGSKAALSQTGTLRNQPGENLHTIPAGFSMWG